MSGQPIPLNLLNSVHLPHPFQSKSGSQHSGKALAIS